jgi:hypothetical protein
MSTINYTYNVIVDRFRQFAAGHFQLRRFTHGEISQADLEKEAEWPWMHVKPRAINYSPGTRAFSFEIFISDLPRDKEDKTGYQAESITDCSLIFQDLINEIHLGHMFGDDVVLTRPVNSEPFVEQYTHTLTGITGTIELNLDYDWSACSIPASWNYNTPTNSPNDGWGALQFIESLDQNGVFVSLLNDEEAPGNSYYYGTDAAGIKGWYAIVDNIGLTCETLPDCATIISIKEDIEALQTDVALKANTADLGPTAFSNSYNDLSNLPTIPAAQVNSDWNSVSGVAEILNKPTIPSIAGLVPDTRTISTTAPITGGGDLTANRTLSMPQATTLVDGYLSATDWTTFNAKQNALGFTPVPSTRTLTINGTTQDLSADRTFTIATGLTVGTTPITSGTVGRVLFEGTGNVLQQSGSLFWDNTNVRLGVGTATPTQALTIASGSIAMTESFPIRWGTSNLLYGSATGLDIASSAFAVRFRFTVGGNFLIGTTTDAGFKLDVNGTARIKGASNVGTTTAFTITNSDSVNLLQVQDNGYIRIGSKATSAFRIYSTDASGDAEPSGLHLTLNSRVVAQTQAFNLGMVTINGPAGTATSGTQNVFLINKAFSPTSGTATYAASSIIPTINQTGGANGITRALYINPTLTAAADFRAIEVASGITILGAATTAKASLRIPSGTAPTSPVNGDIWFDGTNLNVRIGGVTRTIVVL